MFASSLRKLPVWRSLGPDIASSSRWKFAECQNQVFDLAVPVQRYHEREQLAVLIISPASVQSIDLPVSRRIEAFANADSLRHLLIIVAGESEGHDSQSSFRAWVDLQVLLLGFPAIIKSTQVSSPDLIIPHLERYVDGLQMSSLLPQKTWPNPTALIAQAVTTAPARPLSQHHANVLSDLFPSLQALEEATRSEEGQAVIYDYLEPAAAESVVRFWEDGSIM